eukprot:5693763-Prymnesium_polylepis.1
MEAALAVDLIKFGAVTICVHKYFCSSTQCVGPSMLPTIGTSGDIVLTLPVFNFGWSISPQRGDVVVATSPSDPTQTVCKRLLGMPGDQIE